MRQIEKSRTWALLFFVCSISIPGVGQFTSQFASISMDFYQFTLNSTGDLHI
jgi:hypothetical protein